MPKLTVAKSKQIEAPLEKVYQTVRDFRQWPAWSPWLIAEPECEVTYADDGRSYRWDGAVVGAGEMKIVKEEAPRAIDYELTFLKPWKSVSAVRFVFEERDGGVDVTWTMDGSVPFFMFWIKKMMEAMVGMDYERGLAMLKALLETGAVPSQLAFSGAESFQGFRYLGRKRQCAIKDIGPRMEEDFAKVKAWFEEAGACPAGKPFTIYHRWDMVAGATEYTLGFPVDESVSNAPDGFVLGDLPTVDVYSIKHTGPYAHLGNAWAAGMMRGRAKTFRPHKKMPPFETYENDPDEVSENDLMTVVRFPVKA